MISNIHRNCMGTCSFTAQFKGMRKPQEFDVYPIPAGDPADRIKIQSDTRLGYLVMATGEVLMSKSYPRGAHGIPREEITPLDKLTDEDLTLIKSHVMASSNEHAGTNGAVYCDNGGALGVGAAKRHEADRSSPL